MLDGSGTFPLALLEMKAAYTFDFSSEDLGRPVAGNHQGPRPTL
ncbi:MULTISPECIES: hypothetical protein [unclassified Streptomyces]|nr:hypothetical protein [Streptomyces sp. TSRI0107]